MFPDAVAVEMEQIAEMHAEIAALYWTVRFLSWLVCGLVVLEVVQLTSHYVIFARMQKYAARVESLLTLTERHGKSTDARATEMASTAARVAQIVTPLAESAPALQAATAEVVARVAEVPQRVVQAINDSQGDSGELKVVKTPPPKDFNLP